MLRGSTSMKPVHAARCFLILLGLAVGDAAQAQGVSKQATTTARFYSSELRSDTVEIKLAAPGGRDRRDELEWKVRMKAGDTLVYSWTVQLPADQFYFDFHGESDPTPKVKAVSYRKDMGNADNGSMVAPFDGIHGWYLQNQSDKPVVVHLRISGFYEMRPDPYAQ